MDDHASGLQVYGAICKEWTRAETGQSGPRSWHFFSPTGPGSKCWDQSTAAQSWKNGKKAAHFSEQKSVFSIIWIQNQNWCRCKKADLNMSEDEWSIEWLQDLKNDDIEINMILRFGKPDALQQIRLQMPSTATEPAYDGAGLYKHCQRHNGPRVLSP